MGRMLAERIGETSFFPINLTSRQKRSYLARLTSERDILRHVQQRDIVHGRSVLGMEHGLGR